MTTPYYISAYCKIKNNKLSLNGKLLYQDDSTEFLSFIKNAYRAESMKYSKFFKMDNLSKLAFLAADVLLQKVQNNFNIENTALVFSNRAASLDTDRLHQKAIQTENNYYPSPAVFVYTLPNICLGEISIKYNLFTENSFFIFDRFNAEHLFLYANSLLKLNKAEQVLCGWVDFDSTNYDAFLYLVSKNGDLEHTKKNIQTLYNT